MTKEDHDTIQLKLLCGGDVLESFAVPGLWKDEDVSVCKVKVTNIEFKLSCPCISVIYMGLATRKPVFGCLRTTKEQTSLRICTV